ncbi:RNA ligase family protein [Bacillus subtilis]|uniref:RNA ligase family protein n=1 Tax=Bacillus subtilis TaxID=1423 RepID=UPI0011BDF929|nr:RNA ligase family protein [Bacillus subtilis]
MEQKKYTSVIRMGHRLTLDVFKEGDNIVVTEKIDSANASFTLDEKGELKAYSRNTELGEGNTLNGFLQWVHENIDPAILVPDLIYFGEWTGNPHKVRYEGHEKQFFLFDVYSKKLGRYLPFSVARAEANYIGLTLVPVFYEGEYKGYEHLESLVGKTALGGKLGDIETGEGIVVKNYDHFNHEGKQVFVKMVTDAFREVKNQKPPRNPAEIGVECMFIRSTVTPARVEKIFLKMMDEGVLEQDVAIEDMGKILKAVTPAVIADVLKEERDSLPEEYSDKALSKSAGKVVPQIIKDILKERA